MSASFTLSPPYKCNLYTISYNPTLALHARFIHILINLYQFPNIYSQQIQQPQRHTHPTPPHNHPHPHAHTPTHPTLTPPHTHRTYIHYPKHPNLHPSPPPHKHKTLHYNIFKVSNLLQYTYCIAIRYNYSPPTHEHYLKHTDTH